MSCIARHHVVALATAIAAVATLACGGSTEPDDNTNQNPNPGTTVTNVVGRTNRSVTVGGVTRTFVVYVGSSVGQNTAAPVVFMVHGTSGDGDKFYNISGWRPKSDEVGLISVYPDALTYCLHEDENHDGDFTDPGERHVTTKWAGGELGDPAKMPLCTAAELAALPAAERALADHPLRDDLAFFDAMVDYLKSHYVIDQKRIYVTGFSNGAQMSARLAAERGQVFAAGASHAGNLVITPTNGRSMSYISSMGSLDEHLTQFTGGQEIPVNETIITSTFIKGTFVTPMLAQLGLADVYTYDEPIVNGKKGARFTYRTSTRGASNSFAFTLIDDNDHSYPNGTNHPIVMANVLWAFFEGQRLP